MSGRETRSQSRKKSHQLTKIAKLEQELAKAKPSANNYRDFLQRRIAELKSKQPSLKQELGIASSEGFGTKNLLGSTTYNNQSLKPVVSYGPNKDIFRDRKLDPDLSFANRQALTTMGQQLQNVTDIGSFPGGGINPWPSGTPVGEKLAAEVSNEPLPQNNVVPQKEVTTQEVLSGNKKPTVGENRNLLRPRTDQDFRNLSGSDIQRLEQSGGMQYKRGGLAHKLKIAKIRHMSEMAGDG